MQPGKGRNPLADWKLGTRWLRAVSGIGVRVGASVGAGPRDRGVVMAGQLSQLLRKEADMGSLVKAPAIGEALHKPLKRHGLMMWAERECRGWPGTCTRRVS